MKKNSIEWWLSRIADPEIREKALKNLVEHPNVYTGDHKVKGVGDAINLGIYWDQTREGWAYWNDLCRLPPTLLDKPYTEQEPSHGIEPGQVYGHRYLMSSDYHALILCVSDEVVYYVKSGWVGRNEGVDYDIIENFVEHYELIQK